MMDRRQLIANVGKGALAAMAPFVIDSHAQGAVLKVKYDWLMSNGQLGDIVALKRGFLKDQGFEVEFQPGGPNSATVPPVATGQAMIGQFSSTNQAMIAVAAGIPIKVIAAGFRTAPFAYFSLPRAPVRKPEDLVGKRVGTQPTARYVTDALLKKYKIDPSRLQVINMGFDMAPLINGQVDVVTGWVTNTRALSVIGPDRIDYMAVEAGIYNYGNAYFTSDEGLAKNADAIARFLKGVSKGWEWAFNNRDAAVDIMCDAYPQIERDIEKKTVDLVMKLSFDKDTAVNGWGWFDSARIQETAELFASVGVFKDGKSPRVADFTSTRILDATRGERPRLG
jgi:NitT/TauT family transport system substrate-binding protein